jgi:hypothetical protein
MFEAWGEMVLNGLAFSPGSPDWGIFDHLALHQSPADPIAPQAVEALGKSTTTWASLKQALR